MKMYFMGFKVINAKEQTAQPIYSENEGQEIMWWPVADLICRQLIEYTSTPHFLEKYFGQWIIYKNQ